MFDEIQITKAQLRFLMLKGLHLLAAIFIIIMLCLYFNIKSQINKETTENDNEIISQRTGETSYEAFCANNRDIACGSIERFITDSYNEEYGKVILNENIEKKEVISNLIADNSDINIHPEDMNKLLEHLYEEKLPDDIIDVGDKEKVEKSKGIHIIPARKPPYFGSKKAVVIVIDDMGISLKRTAEISSLKAPITASFLTYGRKLDEQINNSLKSGHEIIVHVPMEAQTAVDVAPDVLTTKMSLSEIKANLLAMLKKFKEIKGINNHMGSKLTEDYKRMKTVMETLKEKGLYFLDSKTSPKSRAEKAAQDTGIAYAHRHVFLDNKNEKEYILDQLGKVERLANKNGYAIAIGHPKTQTYAALKEWLPTVDKKGIKIIPLSTAIKILNPNVK